jgi:hypothetical protein
LCDSRGWPQRSQSGEPAQRGQARSPSSSATSRPSEEPQYRQHSHIHASSVGTRCSLSARCDSSGGRSAHVDRCRTRLWRRERRRLLLQPRSVPLEATRHVDRRHLAQLRQRGNDSAPRANHPRAAADRHTSAFVAPSPRRRSESRPCPKLRRKVTRPRQCVHMGGQTCSEAHNDGVGAPRH